MWRALLITCLGFLPMAAWAYSAGIEARVLPNQEADILSVESFEIVELGETSATFSVKTNLPCQVKLLYGPTWQKDLLFEEKQAMSEHRFLINDLRPATLYYYRLYLFNDKDSISLGEQVFKTGGQTRIEWLDQSVGGQENGETTGFKAQNHVPASNLDNSAETVQSSATGQLFGVADLAFLLLCLSIFLLLLAIIKHLKKTIKS